MRTRIYFEGVCYQEMKQFDKAIAILKQALADRSAARVGGVCAGAGAAAHRHIAEAKEHFKRFQHLTSTKIRRADRPGLWRAGTLLDGDAGGGAGGREQGDDSGEAGRAMPASHASKAGKP